MPIDKKPIPMKIQAKTMSFKELASLYFPAVTPKSASHQLRTWIRSSDTLLAELEACGFTPRQRLMTPRQVELVLREFGAPSYVE